VAAALRRLLIEVDFETVIAFVSQEWFKRLWVVQEYTLASKVEILNGQAILSHEELFLAMAILLILLHFRPSPVTERMDQDSFLHSWNIIEQRGVLRILDKGILLWALATHSGRRCKLDQDRVYGLLALGSTVSGLDVEINYSLSVEEVYKKVALAHLESGDLKILQYIYPSRGIH